MKKASDFIKVDQYVSVIGGSVDTDQGMLVDGGRISAVTTPGCWGPMITPRIFGGHEVIRPSISKVPSLETALPFLSKR